MLKRVLFGLLFFILFFNGVLAVNLAVDSGSVGVREEIMLDIDIDTAQEVFGGQFDVSFRKRKELFSRRAPGGA